MRKRPLSQLRRRPADSIGGHRKLGQRRWACCTPRRGQARQRRSGDKVATGKPDHSPDWQRDGWGEALRSHDEADLEDTVRRPSDITARMQRRSLASGRALARGRRTVLGLVEAETDLAFEAAPLSPSRRRWRGREGLADSRPCVSDVATDNAESRRECAASRAILAMSRSAETR